MTPKYPMRCTGHCCRAFPLPVNQTYEMLVAEPSRYEDGEVVAEMLIPIGVNGADGRPLFNCKHHDMVTGDCRIYDQRPSMCREFPYGQRCPIIACTLRPNPPVERLPFDLTP